MQNGVPACTRGVHACRTACLLAHVRCTLAERRASVHEACAGWQNGVLAGRREVHACRSLVSIFQWSFQLIKLLFKPALAGTHQPVMNEKDESYEGKRTEKIGVTHLLRQPV